MTAITPLPTPPSTSSPSTFDTLADAFIAALPTFVTEANALAASLESIASGTVASIPYTFSTTTTDSDPGSGNLRLDNAIQNTATTIRADLVGADGTTWTDVLALLDDSTSTVKGFIMLQELGTGTNWLMFSVSALASPSGYRNITVACVASSAANPFGNGDSILLKFSRTGDKGETGAVPNPINYARATVASHATTADIWTALGNQINWTGTATTTAFPNAPQAGAERILVCAAACSFTAGANMLIDGLSSGETVTCAANDIVIVRAITTTQFRLSRIRYDGRATVESAGATIYTALTQGGF